VAVAVAVEEGVAAELEGAAAVRERAAAEPERALGVAPGPEPELELELELALALALDRAAAEEDSIPPPRARPGRRSPPTSQLVPQVSSGIQSTRSASSGTAACFPTPT
jgi:hypothetical protein